MMAIENLPILTVDEAATRAGISQAAVIDLACLGKIEAVMLAEATPDCYGIPHRSGHWTIGVEQIIAIKRGERPVFRGDNGCELRYVGDMENVRIDAASLRAWIAGNAQADSAKVGAGDTASDWKATARVIGEEWMLSREKETGTRPPIEKIAAHVADELSSRDIRGPRGKYPDAATVTREALKGITGRKRGDNLRR